MPQGKVLPQNEVLIAMKYVGGPIVVLGLICSAGYLGTPIAKKILDYSRDVGGNHSKEILKLNVEINSYIGEEEGNAQVISALKKALLKAMNSRDLNKAM